jgi:putative transposase
MFNDYLITNIMLKIKIWIHVVWSTKYREPTITNKLKPELLHHIRKNANEKGYYIYELNCTSDHIHILLALGPTQNVADFVKQVKGESTRWINLNKLTDRQFKWQLEYYAVSVEPYNVRKISDYIRNQEKQHMNEELE